MSSLPTRQANMDTPVLEAAEVDEAPAKATKGSKGNPKGIVGPKKGKYQARLLHAKDDNHKSIQRFIPGWFDSIPAAEAAQASAQSLFDSGGYTAVWPMGPPAPREKRGTVRAPCSPGLDLSQCS